MRIIVQRVAEGLARISHRLPGQAHDRPAIIALRLLAVLTVLFKYASARQAARASSDAAILAGIAGRVSSLPRSHAA